MQESNRKSFAAEEPGTSWMVSGAFWLCLLLSLILYTPVALAPKLQTYLKLEARSATNQVRLLTLQREVTYLGRVVEAIETDPEFAGELLRLDFDAHRPNEEQIPVGPRLTLNARDDRPVPASPAASLPWYFPAVEVLAENTRLRNLMLLGAGILVIGAFTFLQDTQSRRLRNGMGWIASSLSAFSRRYRKPHVGR